MHSPVISRGSSRKTVLRPGARSPLMLRILRRPGLAQKQVLTKFGAAVLKPQILVSSGVGVLEVRRVHGPRRRLAANVARPTINSPPSDGSGIAAPTNLVAASKSWRPVGVSWSKVVSAKKK